MIDAFSIIVREREKLPPEWRWFRLESFPPASMTRLYTQVTGGIPGVFKSGPRKGRPKFDTKTAKSFVVTEAELDAFHLRYEAETGKCHRCEGEGKTVHSIHVNGTKTFSECRRCGGTGKPPSAT